MKKRVMAIFLLAATVCVTACGSSSSKYAASDTASYSNSAYEMYDSAEIAADYDYDDYAYGEDVMTAYEEASGSSSVSTTENASTSNRKLIRNVSLDVETKDFDSLTKNLYDSISSHGGYIENMSMYNGSSYKSYKEVRHANITARIPAKNLDSFVNTVGESANITSRSESVDDVTLSYVDMTSHRDMLKEEQQRLLDFLAEADNVEEIIALEDRLTDVKYQLESMESQIRTYDNQVDYSTVIIDVEEVKEYTPEPVETKTTGQRISEGFKDSIEDIKETFTEFFIWLVVNIPYIILSIIFIAIAAVIIIAVIKANDKAAAKRKAKSAAKKAESATTTKAEDSAKNAENAATDTTADNALPKAEASDTKSDDTKKNKYFKKPNK